ncbi:ATP-binding protein [Pelosinus sp. sgz500959]|uniref:ATP-binding protein n=1 Tax=Pelosinus sp. sgz500959 TaxID=3242472 RepID=UPI00366AA131
MTIKKRLSVICLIFGTIPLMIVFWLGVKSGLAKHDEFQNGIALALMATIFLGLFSSGLVRYWFLGKQLEKIRTFCLAVKDGCYDVFLPVPNESSDREDENEMVELMRNMNWMAHHIKLNEIQLQSMVANLQQSQEKIQSQNAELETAYAQQMIVQNELENQTNQLTEMIAKIRNLLDHAGQGFVSFGKNLIVADEYSAECVMIFNREIAGENISELLYPHDKKQQAFVSSLLTKILSVEDDFLRDTYISLLPQEIIVDEAYIQINYKFINNPIKENPREIMLILTDITKEKVMEEQIQDEKETLSMIVKVVTQYNDFSDAVEGYTAFCHKEVAKILEWECSALKKISTLFTMVHTWKGTFGQLGMQYIVKELHELEDVLARLRDEEKTQVSELLECFAFYPGEKLYSWLSHELEILQEILGHDFFLQKDRMSIETVRMSRIKEKVQALPDSLEKHDVVLELATLHYKPLRDLLQAYPEYVAELGKRYNKEIEKFAIIGGDRLVNPEIYHKFAQTLVHVFRNAVVHGLETADERLDVGKEEAGSIRCEIIESSEDITVRVIDDGRGIDVEKIKKLAVEKNIIDQQAALVLSDEEARTLIFVDGFSSATCVDDISGRGVGLYAIRKEVEKIGGEIRVTSQVGMGTEFSFVLPLRTAA